MYLAIPFICLLWHLELCFHCLLHAYQSASQRQRVIRKNCTHKTKKLTSSRFAQCILSGANFMFQWEHTVPQTIPIDIWSKNADTRARAHNLVAIFTQQAFVFTSYR